MITAVSSMNKDRIKMAFKCFAFYNPKIRQYLVASFDKYMTLSPKQNCEWYQAQIIYE